MNYHRIFTSALDCIVRFKATRFPLKNVSLDIIKARKLNSGERKILFDLVFDYMREMFLFYEFLHETIAFASSLSVHQKDTLLLQILSVGRPGAADNPDSQSLHQSYREWLTLSDRSLQSLGPFIGAQLKADYGHEAIFVAKGLLRSPKKYLAMDNRFVTMAQVSKVLREMGVAHFFHPVLPRAIGLDQRLDLAALPKSMADHLWFMDAGSQIIAELICPKAHERVLDLCAGEGNKARYITTKDCNYVAVDIDESRLNIAKKRLINKNIHFLVADGRSLPNDLGTFDWVLLDAPCSGVGTLARHPDLAYRLDKASLKDYVALQHELLMSAQSLLRPGGKLIYATCSLLAIENQHQIKKIVSENDQIKPLALTKLVGSDLKLNEAELNKNSLTIFPHINDCDGFYFAILTK